MKTLLLTLSEFSLRDNGIDNSLRSTNFKYIYHRDLERYFPNKIYIRFKSEKYYIFLY